MTYISKQITFLQVSHSCLSVCSLTSCLIEDHTSKVLNAKLGLVGVLRRDVVGVEFVLMVQFVQHGGVCPLEWKKRRK